MYLNRITLIGFIGSDAERKAASATNIAIFSPPRRPGSMVRRIDALAVATPSTEAAATSRNPSFEVQVCSRPAWSVWDKAGSADAVRTTAASPACSLRWYRCQSTALDLFFLAAEFSAQRLPATGARRPSACAKGSTAAESCGGITGGRRTTNNQGPAIPPTLRLLGYEPHRGSSCHGWRIR
jgi:hypothetical protein